MSDVEQTGSFRPRVDLRRRILVALANDAARDDLEARLTREGYAVRAYPSADGLQDEVLSWWPDLVVLGETFRKGTGLQTLLSLRAAGQTIAVPVVGVLEDASVANILRWIRLGGVEAWRYPWTRDPEVRVRPLLQECALTQVQTAPARTRVLAFAYRAGLEGTLVMYPGTPFEGRAVFLKGELSHAQFGPFEGAAAADAMVELDDADPTWLESAELASAHPTARPGPNSRVLVVEDDADVRELVSTWLQKAGYRVDTAPDGALGLQRALGTSYDLVVLDLNLPRLDGWGLLRRVREDVVARESAVVMLSAQDDLDTLKAAQAGARAYLKKTGRARELLDAAALLAGPRAEAWASLEQHRETTVELRTVGAVWLVRALAELDCAGRLEVEDALGRYELVTGDGMFLEATTQTGSLRVAGAAALEGLLTSRGRGRFVFAPVKRPESAPWLYDVVDRVCASLRRKREGLLAEALARPGQLRFDEELAQLFARDALASELRVLFALRQHPETFDALVESAGLEQELVQSVLGELLRRGVVSVEA